MVESTEDLLPENPRLVCSTHSGASQPPATAIPRNPRSILRRAVLSAPALTTQFATLAASSRADQSSCLSLSPCSLGIRGDRTRRQLITLCHKADRYFSACLSLLFPLSPRSQSVDSTICILVRFSILR